jgi:PAS domain S-box-containing protein
VAFAGGNEAKRGLAASNITLVVTEGSGPVEGPHTVLGKTINAFVASLDEASRKLMALDLRSGADERRISAAARELREAWELVSVARDELAGDLKLLEEVAEERVRYGDLFEAAPEAYVVTDEDGRILEANRAAERLLGRPRGELERKPLDTLLDPGDREAFRLTLDRRSSETVTDWELAFRAADGTLIPVAVSVTRDWGRDVTTLRWLIRDITERKRLEKRVISANLELERRVRERTAELESAKRQADETLDRLEAIVKQMPAGVIIADASSGRLITANGEAQRLLREISHGDESLVDAWLAEGFYADGRPYWPDDRPIERALRGETTENEQVEFSARDGTRKIFEIGAAPIRDRDGTTVAAVATLRDVTARERRARAEREFTTNAAHELRTPIAALSSALEVLEAGAKETPGDRDRFLRHASRECARLQRLVRSLLVLARAQTGAEQPAMELIEVGALLESVAAAVDDERVRVEHEPISGLGIVADRDLAEQALLNLISNAVKYAPTGEVLLGGRQENGAVLLEVSDHGRGMTAEERERALERFYRGGEHDEQEGFGLGLAIASQVAEALGGTLELDSVPGGQGTIARLRLPAASL